MSKATLLDKHSAHLERITSNIEGARAYEFKRFAKFALVIDQEIFFFTELSKLLKEAKALGITEKEIDAIVLKFSFSHMSDSELAYVRGFFDATGDK